MAANPSASYFFPLFFPDKCRPSPGLHFLLIAFKILRLESTGVTDGKREGGREGEKEGRKERGKGRRENQEGRKMYDNVVFWQYDNTRHLSLPLLLLLLPLSLLLLVLVPLSLLSLSLLLLLLLLAS